MYQRSNFYKIWPTWNALRSCLKENFKKTTQYYTFSEFYMDPRVSPNFPSVGYPINYTKEILKKNKGKICLALTQSVKDILHSWLNS